MSLLSTGLSALSTAQLGVATAYHNISNANTAGYSRQATMQATNAAMFSGSGFVGQGVHVETIQRSYSAILNGQVYSAQSKSSELDTYYSMISRIDNLLAESSSGISPVLAGFFQGVQDVAANPSLTSARQSMVTGAQALANRYQILNNRLTQLYDEVNVQIQNSVGMINTYSAQIANLNEKILMLSSSGHQPNDLMDERDQMVLELNKLVRISTVTDSDGNINVFAGMGQQLVVGNMSLSLEARPSAEDPEQYVIAQKGGLELPSSYFDGGTLGGLLSFRSEALNPAANALGQMAASIALTINAQQSLGQDLLGNVFGDAGFVSDIFKISAPKAIENAKNGGTGSVASFEFLPPNISPEGNYYTELTTSDYEVRFAAGGNFTITRLSDKTVVATGTEGTPVTFDGLRLDFSAGHNNGDSYLLQPTREVSRNFTVSQEITGDVRRIAAASPVRTSAGSNNVGTATISAGEITGHPYNLSSYPITLTYNAGMLSASGTPGTVLVNGTPATFPIAYNSGDVISLDNFAFSISGMPLDGDTFLVEANTGGVADSRNIVRLGALQTAQTMNGSAANGRGIATYQVAYAQLVSDIGTKTKTVQVNSQAQATVLDQAMEARNSVAGVNLDEEWANIMQYQLSYQAAARMMDTVTKLFDVMVNIGR